MAVWGRLGINYGDTGTYSAAQTTADLTLLWNLGFRKIRIVYPQYVVNGTTTAAYTNMLDMIDKALDQGFYVMWGVATGAAYTGANWTAYKTEVAIIATYLQTNYPSANLQFSVGNEAENENSGAGAPSDATVRADIATLATTCQTNYTAGPISYEAAQDQIDAWNTAGMGDLDFIGFNCYDTNANFETNVGKVKKFFGSKGLITEWSPQSGFSGTNDENLYKLELNNKLSILKQINPEAAYFFVLQPNTGFTFDIKVTSTTYRDGWYWLINSRQFVPQSIGKAIKLFGSNGTERVAVTPVAAQNNLDAIGISVWLKPTFDGFNKRIFYQANAGNTVKHIDFYFDAGNNLVFEVGWTTTGKWNVGSGQFTDGAWQHVFIGYDVTSLTNDPVYYVNAVLKTPTETQAPLGSITLADANITIGNAVSYNRSFNGIIDELRFYNRILTSAEVSTLNSKGDVTDGLVGYWSFDYTKNDTAIDFSSSRTDGTIVGNVQIVDGNVNLVGRLPSVYTVGRSTAGARSVAGARVSV